MKKRTIMIVASILTVFILFGCAAETPATSSAPASSASVAAASATQAPASSAAPAASAAASQVAGVDQGIPANWVEVQSLAKKYPGPEVSLADWMKDNKALKGKSNYKIAYVMYSMQNEFPVLMSEAAKKRAGQIGVTVDFFDAKMDVNVEHGIVENAIANQYNAVIFNPVDSAGSDSIVKLANDAKIPAVCVNALLNNLDGLAGSVSSDHIQSGELIAKYMIDNVLKGKGNIVIPEGPFAQSAVLDRSQGIYNIVRQNPGIKILAHDTANWSRSEALDLMSNWLNTYPDQIDAVVGENDEMALGSLQAVKTSGTTKKIYGGGIDAIPDALTSIDNGELSATVLQDAIAQSVIGLDLTVKILNGDIKQGESTNYWVPYELVTPDKTKEYRARTDLSVLD